MKNKNLIIKVAIIAVVLSIIVFALVELNFFRGISLESVQNYINSYGKFAAPIFILVFSIRTLFLIVPYALMVMFGGSLFGPFEGFMYSMVSVFICANIAFLISRHVGKESLQKILGKRLNKIDLKIEQHGFKIVLLMRLSCLFPFDISNYAAGLTKVRYRDYILGTMLGIIPETFSLTYLGENIKNPLSINFLLAVILVIVTVAVPFLINKRKTNKNQD